MVLSIVMWILSACFLFAQSFPGEGWTETTAAVYMLCHVVLLVGGFVNFTLWRILKYLKSKKDKD